MYNYTCLNPIAGVGLNLFSDDYSKVEDIKDADAALVRSAAMHDMELGDNVLAVARAGAGVNNIPLDKCAEKGIVVFNTPGANANGNFAYNPITNVAIIDDNAVAVNIAPASIPAADKILGLTINM